MEHPYRIVKNIFGFRKTVYRGLSKNLNRLYVLFASANLYMLARAGGTLSPALDSCTHFAENERRNQMNTPGFEHFLYDFTILSALQAANCISSVAP